MDRSRWLISLSMLLVVAISMACVTLFPGTDSDRAELKFEPDALPNAQVDVPYEVQIKISENNTPVGNFSVAPGSLPPGLELAIVEEVEDTARIIGIPEEPGTYSFKISVWCYGTNVSGETGEKEYTIVVE